MELIGAINIMYWGASATLGSPLELNYYRQRYTNEILLMNRNKYCPDVKIRFATKFCIYVYFTLIYYTDVYGTLT